MIYRLGNSLLCSFYSSAFAR